MGRHGPQVAWHIHGASESVRGRSPQSVGSLTCRSGSGRSPCQPGESSQAENSEFDSRRPLSSESWSEALVSIPT